MGAAEDKMVREHHWLNGHEFEQIWEIVEDRGACCAAVHGVAESGTWLNNNRNFVVPLACPFHHLPHIIVVSVCVQRASSFSRTIPSVNWGTRIYFQPRWPQRCCSEQIFSYFLPTNFGPLHHPLPPCPPGTLPLCIIGSQEIVLEWAAFVLLF